MILQKYLHSFENTSTSLVLRSYFKRSHSLKACLHGKPTGIKSKRIYYSLKLEEVVSQKDATSTYCPQTRKATQSHWKCVCWGEWGGDSYYFKFNILIYSRMSSPSIQTLAPLFKNHTRKHRFSIIHI